MLAAQGATQTFRDETAALLAYAAPRPGQAAVLGQTSATPTGGWSDRPTERSALDRKQQLVIPRPNQKPFRVDFRIPRRRTTKMSPARANIADPADTEDPVARCSGLGEGKLISPSL